MEGMFCLHNAYKQNLTLASHIRKSSQNSIFFGKKVGRVAVGIWII